MSTFNFHQRLQQLNHAKLVAAGAGSGALIQIHAQRLPARDVGRGAEADRRISQPDACGVVREGASVELGF